MPIGPSSSRPRQPLRPGGQLLRKAFGFSGRDECGPYPGFSPNTVQKRDAHPDNSSQSPHASRQGLVSTLHRTSGTPRPCLGFTVRHFSGKELLALGPTSKSPVLSYRGPEDLQERIVSYVRCFSSWPWLSLNSSHQQPCDATAGGNVSRLSLCPVRTTAGSAPISQQGVFGSIHLFSHRDSKPEMPRCPCPR
jgi:hypothetical protein